MNTCAWCQSNFGLEADSVALVRVSPKIGSLSLAIPPPKLCPECRQQRRFCFRNDQFLYRDSCKICQKNLVTNYAPPKGTPILCEECFWSDRWDPLSYGRDFNFSKPFFEQFQELKRQVPRLGIYNTQSENSQYTVHSSRNKNCYSASSIVDCEELLYCDFSNRSQSCLDLFSCQEMELSYECLFSSKCYNTDYAEHCHAVSDSYLCFDCRASSALVGCVGLRSKTNYLLNEPVSANEIKEAIFRLKNDLPFRERLVEAFEELKLSVPRPPNWTTNVENCSGNYQTDCKNIDFGFNVLSCEDGRYLYDCYIDQDLYDCTRSARSELLYECSGAVDLRFSLFCVLCYQSDNLIYCDNCQGTSSSFGSMSLKKHRFCILNKHYSQTDYEQLVPKIVEQMKHTGEWGEFFPPQLSPFAYNETKAADWYPLTEAEVQARGWEWTQYEAPLPEGVRVLPPISYQLPIEQVSDEILSGAINCSVTNKPFRIVPLELEFYRKKGIRVPSIAPKARHRARMARLAGRRLHKRFCEKCGTQIETTYAPEQPELVYCEKCYLDFVW